MDLSLLLSVPLSAILAIAGSPLDSIDLFTGRIDTTTTLATWLRTHPNEIVSDSVPDRRTLDEICRTARSRVTIAGRNATRWAVFSVPKPPPGEHLPQATPDVAERECRLSALWLVLEEPDSAIATALAGSLTRLVEARLGRGTPRSTLGGPGHAGWQEPRTWKGPGTMVVLGIRPPEERPISEDGQEVTTAVRSPGSVSILTYAPYRGFDDLDSPEYDRSMDDITEEEGWEKKWILDKTDSAIARAAVPSIVADLRVVLNRLRSNGSLDSASSAAALVRAAAAIRDRAPTLKPPQRAALLLAGDLILQRAAPAFGLGTDTTTSHYRLYNALTAAGVEYGPEAYMVGKPYTRAWLWEAYRLDSLGTAGRAAFHELLASGWKTTAGCGEGKVDQIALVIQHGEAAMRRGDIDPLISYYVGIAYQDRFSLARGNHYEGYASPELYEPKAEESRLLAIERLRTSLLALKERHLRRDAWRTAMRLMLGITSQPRYFCFDD